MEKTLQERKYSAVTFHENLKQCNIKNLNKVSLYVQSLK
jgi:hypothetical protein